MKQASDFDRLLITPEARPTSEIPYHHDTAPGVRRVFLEKKLFPEAEAYVMVRSASGVQSCQPGYIDAHAHSVSSIYLFIGAAGDLTGLRAEVILGEETFEVASPATVYIPGGMSHYSRIIGGSGHFCHIVLKGDYRESLTEASGSRAAGSTPEHRSPREGEGR